jgi:hypothetical protein
MGLTDGTTGPGWSFLGNHAYILICITAEPDARMRDLALRVGITERAVQWNIGELQAAGYLTTEHVGRRNRYEVYTDGPLRHPLVGHRSVGHLLELGLGGRPKKR